MLLFPKKVKHRKWQRDRKDMENLTPATRGATLAFGSFGLKAQAGARLRSNQIEAARKVARRTATKVGKIWIRVFPDRPYTEKPPEVPMGTGKGDVEAYEVEVRPGRVIFEIDGVSETVARRALEKAGKKLPVKTKVVKRTHV